MADVTVSIVSMNGRELLLDCLESLVEAPAEVVVLDNASEDGSVEAVRKRFPQVRVIEQLFRAGFGANHNRVIRSSNARYIFVLNPDTVVPTGTLQSLVTYLDAHPGVAIAGPLIRGFDGRQQGSAWRLMTIPVQLAWALTLGRRGAVQSRGTVPKAVGAVSASAMLVRREAFEEVGGFDEEYFMFSEEADLARRLVAHGYECHYVPAVEVIHLGQHTTASFPEHQVNEIWRSLGIYLRRYHSPAASQLLRWSTGAGYGLGMLAAAVARALPRRFRPHAAATADLVTYRLHVRNALHGVRGPGFRELADEWNEAHPQRTAERRPA